MTSRVDGEMLVRLPQFNRFLARLSVAMSHGKPVAEIAWLRADASFPDAPSIEFGRVDPKAGESETTRVLRARGLVYDRISRKMLAGARVGEGRFRVGARSYRGLILDPMEVAEPELVDRIADLAEAGIPVFVLGPLPSRAPGLRNAEARDRLVRKSSARLGSRAVGAESRASFEQRLSQAVRPGLVEPMPGENFAVSLERRSSPAGEILLVFNESWSTVKTQMRFTRSGGPLLLWNPETGTRQRLRGRVNVGEAISLELEPVGLRILTLAHPEKNVH